jgi:hypothetical protein
MVTRVRGLPRVPMELERVRKQVCYNQSIHRPLTSNYKLEHLYITQ